MTAFQTVTHALPLIDISPFLADESAYPSSELHAAAKRVVAQSVHNACKDVGFMYLVGHGISKEEREKVLQLARDFFALPTEQKEEISIANGDLARGYQRLMQNITRYKKDYHEGIDLYAPIDDSHTLRKKGIKTMAGENQWPSTPAEFRETYETYIEKLKKVGVATLRAMAMGLGLDENFFDKYVSDPFWGMRVIGYPPLAEGEAIDPDVGVSCGQHTDYGCLTILHTDETPRALQVMSKTGDWIDANPVPDAFVANIGDMFATWTNGLYAATLHQVVHRGQNFRVSVPFFFEPNFDALIEPLTFLNPSSNEFEAVVYGEHLLGKVTSNFDVDNTETGLFPRQPVGA
ncbi:hypothetical protein BJ742DRAFT_289274 [Cladochytrium replicatum]|nr:hypothetical protein BJ742DRAFT_289274 [Cladochytrium replicatum]